MCGIFGAISKGCVRDDIIEGIGLLQHRGQEAAGILLIDNKNDTHHLVKTTGDLSNLVQQDLTKTKGQLGVAHLRYTTTGNNDLCNAQPFWTDETNIGFVHNGQVENMLQLQAALHRKGKQLTSASDAEILIKLFSHYYSTAKEKLLEDRIFNAVRKTQQSAIGGYSCILPLQDAGLLAFKDPRGVRPLVMGERNEANNNTCAFSSESIALELSGYTNIQNLQPGEAVLIKEDLRVTRKVLEQRAQRNCAFEYFYFADASSVMEGASINDVRYAMGQRLAQRCKHLLESIDIITPIPETPRPAAAGFCDATGKPYKDIIYKSRHVKRIFITPGQDAREKKAQQGFRYDKSAFKDKRVMLIDDSIVRGTNMREIIKNVRLLGATQVHVGVTWPPIIASCPYGVDMPNLLVAKDRTMNEIREYLGADTLTYIMPNDVFDILGRKSLCMGCITGIYPTQEQTLDYFKKRFHQVI